MKQLTPVLVRTLMFALLVAGLVACSEESPMTPPVQDQGPDLEQLTLEELADLYVSLEARLHPAGNAGYEIVPGLAKSGPIDVNVRNCYSALESNLAACRSLPAGQYQEVCVEEAGEAYRRCLRGVFGGRKTADSLDPIDWNDVNSLQSWSHGVWYEVYSRATDVDTQRFESVTARMHD